MSLTTMLKGKKEIDLELQMILKEIIPNKKQFCTVSGTEAFSSKYRIAAPYNLKIPYHSSVVGTAFDYMARFMISQKVTTNKDHVTVGLTAENGLERIKCYCDKKLSSLLEEKFNQGVILINQFILNKEMKVDDLLPYAAFMARLEHIYRAGMPPREMKDGMLDDEENHIIADLKQLCEVFRERFMIPQVMTSESNVVFNPHFGIASKSCGGADADIYIDGTLYDFKTSKATGYKWQEIAQIFGYYFLNCIAADLKDNRAKLHGYEIKRLAFYKARYGEVEFIDIATMDIEKMELVVKKLQKLLEPR